MTHVKYLVLNICLIIQLSYGIDHTPTEKVNLDLSKSGKRLVEDFVASFTKFLEKYDFKSTHSTATFVYDIIPPDDADIDIEQEIRDAIIRTISANAPEVKEINITGVEFREFKQDQNELQRIEFTIRVSNKGKKTAIEKDDTISLQFSSLNEQHIEKEISSTIGALYTEFNKVPNTPITKKFKIVLPSDATDETKEIILSIIRKNLNSRLKAPFVGTVKADDKVTIEKTEKQYTYHIHIGKRNLAPEKGSNMDFTSLDNNTILNNVKSSSIVNASTKENINCSYGSSPIVRINLSTIHLDRTSNVKEKIIDLVTTDMFNNFLDETQRKHYLLSFQTVRKSVTPEEMKYISAELFRDIEDLEPNATIYSSTFYFGLQNNVLIRFPVDLPPLLYSAIYNLKRRFPEVKNHLVTFNMRVDLGKITSKVEQILGYKLLTAKRVDTGETIYFTLPFKIKNEAGHHYDTSLLPLIKENLKYHSFVNFERSNSESIDPDWTLLKVEVSMPYSINRARYGLFAHEEEVLKPKYRPWFQRLLG